MAVVRISGPRADAALAGAGRQACPSRGGRRWPRCAGGGERLDRGARPPLSRPAQRHRRGCGRAPPPRRPGGGRGGAGGAGAARRACGRPSRASSPAAPSRTAGSTSPRPRASPTCSPPRPSRSAGRRWPWPGARSAGRWRHGVSGCSAWRRRSRRRSISRTRARSARRWPPGWARRAGGARRRDRGAARAAAGGAAAGRAQGRHRGPAERRKVQPSQCVSSEGGGDHLGRPGDHARPDRSADGDRRACPSC